MMQQNVFYINKNAGLLKKMSDIFKIPPRRNTANKTGMNADAVQENAKLPEGFLLTGKYIPPAHPGSEETNALLIFFNDWNPMGLNTDNITACCKWKYPEIGHEETDGAYDTWKTLVCPSGEAEVYKRIKIWPIVMDENESYRSVAASEYIYDSGARAAIYAYGRNPDIAMEKLDQLQAFLEEANPEMRKI